MPTRKNRHWTIAEERKLKEMFDDKVSRDEMANIMDRTVEAISKRLSNMGVFNDKRQGYSPININNEPEIAIVLDVVSRKTKTPIVNIIKVGRKGEILRPRQIAHSILKNNTNFSLKTIGDAIGGKDHATVLNSCKSINNLIDTNKEFREHYSEIEEECVNRINKLNEKNIEDYNNNKLINYIRDGIKDNKIRLAFNVLIEKYENK